MKIDVKKVRIEMAKRGVNQNGLANLMGISKQRLSYMITRGRSFSTVEKIATILNVPVKSLLVE
jgi:DNA-binding Xre family transcriptional regulator